MTAPCGRRRLTMCALGGEQIEHRGMLPFEPRQPGQRSAGRGHLPRWRRLAPAESAFAMCSSARPTSMGLRREAMARAAMADRANAWSAQAPTNTSGKRVPPAANCCCKANPFMLPIRYRVSRRRTRRAAATPGRPRPSRKKTCVAGVLGQIFHGKAHRPVVIDHADEGVAGTASIAARRAHIAARFMAAVPHRSPGAFEPVTRRARRSDGGSEAS